MAQQWVALHPQVRVGVPSSVYQALNRVAAALLLVVLSPVLITSCIAVRLESRGPALFKQQRLGLHRQPFTMFKLRTMRAGSADDSHRSYVTALLSGDVHAGGEPGIYKLAHDNRVTTVGAFLRRTSLDELPQLLNVLRGEMLLVGPRPPLEWEAELFPAWAEPRFDVKPGLTGLWQVSGRSTVDFVSALRLDVQYVARRSLSVDVGILFRTLNVLLGRSVAR